MTQEENILSHSKPISDDTIVRPDLNHQYQFDTDAQIAKRYKVIKPLGYGGFAEVYHCRDMKLTKDVAVKILNETETQIGLQEARASAPLKHSNIVGVIDVSEQDSKISYIVFEYVKGKTLQKRLKEEDDQRLPLDSKTLKIFKQIADALDYAHNFNEGVIHRDIKSSNIILREDGTAFLTDFGLAEVKQEPGEVLSAVTKDLQPSTLRGTLIYMAPEQLRTGKPGDKFSDQYSFGVTVYEALTGRYPFHGANSNHLFFSIVADEPTKPCTANPKLPQGVEDVLLKVLSKESKDRYISCTAFIEALSSAADAYLKASDLYDEAVANYGNEDWLNALQLFEQLEEQAPSFRDTTSYLLQTRQKVELLNLFNKANNFVEQGRIDEALEILTSIGKRDHKFKASQVKVLRDTAIEIRIEHIKESLGELYAQAKKQYKQGEYQACLNTLDMISGKDAEYPDSENIQEKAQAALDREIHLNELYDQAAINMQNETWDQALSILQQLVEEAPSYKDVTALITTSRVMYKLSSFLKKAQAQFDEKACLDCLVTLNELKRNDDSYKSDQINALRKEALDGLFQQSKQLLAKNKFDESLCVLDDLQNQQADYPGIEEFRTQIKEAKRIYLLKLKLDDLYEQAKAALTNNQYWDALTLWSQIEEEEVEFNDLVDVAGRAKFALYTNAKSALSHDKPEEAIAIWERLVTFDTEYPDPSSIREQTNTLIAQREENEEKRRKIIIWGGGIVGLIAIGVILFFIVRLGSTLTVTTTLTPTNVATEDDATQTAMALGALSATPTETATLNPTATQTLEPTPTLTKTLIPTASPTPETPTPGAATLATAVLASTIYKEADENSDELTFVAIGDIVEVLEVSSSGNWLLVENKDGVTGWVAKNRFEIDGPTPTPNGSSSTALVSSSLFCSPDSTSEEITFVTEGDFVEVIGRSANESWLFVRDRNGNEGFSAANRYDWPEERISQLSIIQPDPACSGTTSAPVTTRSSVTLAAIYPISDGACQNGGWVRNLFAEALGGDGTYRYYWNGELVGGPTSSSVTFEVGGPGGSIIGKIRVESGGYFYEDDFYVSAPDCP